MTTAVHSDGSQRRLGAARALATLALAFVGAQLLGAMASQLAAPGLSRAALADASNALATRAIIASMVASELALLCIALAAPLLLSLQLGPALGLRRATPQVFAAAAVGTILLGPAGDALMTAVAERFPGLGFGVVDALHDIARRLPLVLLWPAFALLPGIAEELLFRGVLQRSVPRGALAVAMSGVAFALFHADPIHVVGVLPLGLFLAWTGQRAGTTVTIVAHVLNNTVALLAIRSDALDVGYATGNAVPLSWLVGSLAGAGVCAWLVGRGTREAVG